MAHSLKVLSAIMSLNNLQTATHTNEPTRFVVLCRMGSL